MNLHPPALNFGKNTRSRRVRSSQRVARFIRLGTFCFASLLFTSSSPCWGQQQLAANEHREGGIPIRKPSCAGCEALVSFIEQVHLHGFPVGDAEPFRRVPGARDVLASMLDDPSEQAHWPNIVLTLGVIGGHEAATTLAGFLQRSASGEMSYSEYTARVNVPIALGYLANETTERDAKTQALRFLTEGLAGKGWQEDLRWTSHFYLTEKERKLYLTLKSAQGLALSAEPRAHEALVRFNAQLKDYADAQERGSRIVNTEGWPTGLSSIEAEHLQETLAKCMQVHADVLKMGLAAYYR